MAMAAVAILTVGIALFMPSLQNKQKTSAIKPLAPSSAPASPSPSTSASTQPNTPPAVDGDIELIKKRHSEKGPTPVESKIKPDSGKEPWTVFANAVGPNQAKAKMLECAQKLQGQGYRIEYRNNPYRDNDWGFNAIVGPEGEVYGTNPAIIKLLASVF